MQGGLTVMSAPDCIELFLSFNSTHNITQLSVSKVSENQNNNKNLLKKTIPYIY